MEDQEIVVYWRPRCMFCASLLRKLDRRGVPHRRVNIWDDPTGAAVVRAAANGNETVPTVAVGPVVVVNPDVHSVLALAAQHVPVAVPDDETLGEVRRLAEADDRSVSSWIRRAVEHELEQQAG